MRVPVVGKSYGSWKKQLGKTRSWKVWHEIGKNEVEKFGLKLERMKLESQIEVRKFEPKFEGTTEVGKRMMKLESFDLTWKKPMRLESYN